jgi:hypothetical protein
MTPSQRLRPGLLPRIAPGLTAVLVLCGAAGAYADDFSERCAQLPAQAKISVEFLDTPVVTDDTRNVQALNGLSGKPPDGMHNTYGLTHANPVFKLGVSPRGITDGHGQFCAVPDISLRLSFSEFVVYLATELTDECRRDIIRSHEQEHVNTWRSQLRASAQLIATVLRRDVSEARVYMSNDAMNAGVRAWATELVAPLIKRMAATANEAQQAIDTPTSYSIVASRLRTCSQAVRGGSR